MTVAENVGYGLAGARHAQGRMRRPGSGRCWRSWAWARLAARYPAQLSGGQRQRTALARAIVLEPELVLLDEPLGALDAELRRQMQEFLKSLQRRIRTAFLFVTHDQEEAITMSDRIVVMRRARSSRWAPAGDLLAPAHRVRRRLLRRQQPDPGRGRAARQRHGADRRAPGHDGRAGERRYTGRRASWRCGPRSLTLRTASRQATSGRSPAKLADLIFTRRHLKADGQVPALPDQPLRVQITSRPGDQCSGAGHARADRVRPAEAAVVPA